MQKWYIINHLHAHVNTDGYVNPLHPVKFHQCSYEHGKRRKKYKFPFDDIHTDYACRK